MLPIRTDLLKFLKNARRWEHLYPGIRRTQAAFRVGVQWHATTRVDNLGGNSSINKSGKLYANIAAVFGSYETWEKDFRATGAMRGIGWAVLYQDSTTGKLMNFWINEHDMSHPAGCTPILIMDVFEHAFILDYGLKRSDYIEAFSEASIGRL